ncbi:MAG TPA: hypothetical protein PKE27_12030 [Povalibacter sp.]|uniref:hypothetical protein n=1 Tax=Povalibacter sp. TaxID=1962978 RepID=UPI002CD443DD|nr:hypothetical protein [Povalibacter sp.]HMN45301.1 hypothetical protein [Povalibacter sp.]
MTRLTLAVLAGCLLPLASPAAGPVGNDTVVRIQSASIEGGWHQGRLQLDAQKCWMVKLDKPTRDHYTMLALIVVNQLQVSNGGGWSPVGLKPVLQAQPEVCREYAND